MPKRDLFNYYKRWTALDDLIRSAFDTYRRAEPFPRQGAIVDLLGSLRQFAAGQFQFFYYGFDPIHPARSEGDWPLTYSGDFPPEDVLVGIILQTGHDLALIQQVAEQRRSGNTIMTAALEAADKLAWLALQPATDHKVVEEPEIVITYFEKSSGYYSIPYKKAAVIAVPFTTTMKDNHEDYLAVPHEVGHYVYRHLRPDPKDALKAASAAHKIPEASKPYLPWIRKVFEEMCADIYGCLVAGPVMAIDFQKLELENSRVNMIEGDVDHPNGALRPLIYCQVLSNELVRNLSRDDWGPIASQLAIRWNTKLDDLDIHSFEDRQPGPKAPDQQVTRINSYPIAVSLKPICDQNNPNDQGPLGDMIKLIIEAIGLFLSGSGQNPAPGDLIGWAGKVNDNTGPDDLFPNFGRWYVKVLPRIGLPGEAAPEGIEPDADLPTVPPFPADAALPKSSLVADENDHTPELWLKWLKDKNRDLDLQSQRKPEISAGPVLNPTDENKGQWGYILWAEGWTTEGPSNSHMPPLI